MTSKGIFPIAALLAYGAVVGPNSDR